MNSILGSFLFFWGDILAMSLEKKAIIVISAGLLIMSGCVGKGLQKETSPNGEPTSKHVENPSSLIKVKNSKHTNRMLAWIELSRD